jgi:hypothetical protein
MVLYAEKEQMGRQISKKMENWTNLHENVLEEKFYRNFFEFTRHSRSRFRKTSSYNKNRALTFK